PASRRKFLQYLAGSPLLAAAGGFSAFAGEGFTPGTKLPDPLMWAPMRAEELIPSPKEAINVFDFEPVCRNNVPPAHFGYMASGIEDRKSTRLNSSHVAISYAVFCLKKKKEELEDAMGLRKTWLEEISVDTPKWHTYTDAGWNKS